MNNIATLRHPHSPRSPSAATAMLDRVVSSRRAAPHATDSDAVASSPGSASEDDESKTKRQHISLLASNYLSRIGHGSSCLTVCIVGFFVVVSLVFHYSRSLVCISPYDPLSRIGPGLYRPDAIESDFGYLGVPWCKSLCSLHDCHNNKLFFWPDLHFGLI